MGVALRVKEGCPLSPFIIYTKVMIREAFENAKEGVLVGTFIFNQVCRYQGFSEWLKKTFETACLQLGKGCLINK